MLTTDNVRYTVFDAPGHEKYIPSMIQGAAMADVAVLVVSARRGEFESGFEDHAQTKEHAQLARTLGVQRVIVAVNKMDDPTVKWYQKRFTHIQDNVSDYLLSIGYQPSEITFVSVSGLNGDNLMTRYRDSDWYDGPSLVQALDQVDLPD